jgi:hypothetical protein
MTNSQSLTSNDRPALQQYMETPNRLAFGERTVIVMASKVAQKSYGQERRYVPVHTFLFVILCALNQ